jgi:hypothetical protein
VARAGACFGCFACYDLRTVFGASAKLPTETILDRLISLEESPWGDLRGKELDARSLARRLGKYGVKPKVYRDGDHTVRGYEAADLADPWSRYLPDGHNSESQTDTPHPYEERGQGTPPQERVTAVTPQQSPFVSACTSCDGAMDDAAVLADSSTCTGCDLKALTA